MLTTVLALNREGLNAIINSLEDRPDGAVKIAKGEHTLIIGMYQSEEPCTLFLPNEPITLRTIAEELPAAASPQEPPEEV